MMERPKGSGRRLTGVVVLLAFVLGGPVLAQPKGPAPEQDAQELYVLAMQAYDTGQFDDSIRLLDRASRAAQKLPDKSWRTSVQKTIVDAKIGILYEAGIARWEAESYRAAVDSFVQCEKLLPRKDPRADKVRKNIAKSAYMLTLQLWLNHQYNKARDAARQAEIASKAAYKAGSPLKTKLDEIYIKITHKHTEELVSQGEIKQAYNELKKDYKILPDPTFAYKLGELGTELRAFGEAERYFAKASDRAAKLVAAGSSRSGELQNIINGSREKIVHIRSLRRKVVVKSNVPHYQVEIYRPYNEDPLDAGESAGAGEGVGFELYPGRYRLKVINADYGVCTREDIPVGRENLELDCDFEKPPTVVSIDTDPTNVKVKIVPSTMIAARRTPFQTELYRGSYTLQASMEDFEGVVEVPFVVENDTHQEFHFNLDYAELDISVPDGATVRVDGKFQHLGVEPVRVGIGSHLVEITKPGFLAISQRLFLRPREVKTIFYEMQPLDTTPPDFVYEAPALDATVGYTGEIVGYDVTTQAAGEKEKVQSTAFPLHHVIAFFDIYLTNNKDATLKPYIRTGADIAFAKGSPIDSLMDIDAQLGFGILMDRMEKAALDVHIDYHFRYGFWTDSIVKPPFEMAVISPLGLGVSGRGNYDAFQVELDLGFSTGSGQRNITSAAGGGSDITMTWFELMAFTGLDLVDVFNYNPDLDVALGLTGGMLWYGEDQTPDGKPAESFSSVDGRLGAGLRVRYVTKGSPRTAFMLDVDALFLGGLLPDFPGIVQDKVDVKSHLGNITIQGAVELRF